MKPEKATCARVFESGHAWSALTIRVAWALYQARIRSSPSLLQEVREHVLLSLPGPLSCDELEQCAARATEDYLERALEGRYRGPQAPHPPLPSVDARWRGAIERACDPSSLAVFRLRYGDGLSCREVARHCGLDPSSLQALIESLRELARSEARVRGVSCGSSSCHWADALLSQVACASGQRCPDAGALTDFAQGEINPAAEEHVGSCPRCARAVRLLRAGLLSAADLQQPREPQPLSEVALLALHLHPRARQHQAALAAALGRGVRRVGDDSLLVDVGRAPEWRAVLEQRVRMGLPPRDHIRGALHRGAGRWSRRVVIGPAPVTALDASRARPWGEVDGIEALPDPLPPPPSVARWWTGSIAMGLLALLVGAWVLLQRQETAAYPLQVESLHGGGALIARFDVDNRAFIDAYSFDPAGVSAELVSASTADKAALATGDGDYELVTLRGGLVLVSSPQPIEDLHEVFAAQVQAQDPARGIRTALRERYPDSDVAVLLPGEAG